MRAERKRIATYVRAEGVEQDLKIRAVANRTREVILAEAQADADKIKLSTEGRVVDNLIQALAEHNRLFGYTESLEAYKISKGLISN